MKKRELVEWIMPYLIVEVLTFTRLAYNYLVELEDLRLWLIYTTGQILVFIIFSIWFVLKNGDKLSRVGFKSESILGDVIWGLSYGVLIFAVNFLILSLAFMLAYTFTDPIIQVVTLGPSLRTYYPPKYFSFPCSLVFFPLTEELYFRGYSLYKLEKAGIRKNVTSFLQGLIFSLNYWRLGLIRGMVSAFLTALLLERVYIKRRSLAANFTARVIDNVFKIILLGY